MNAPNQRYVVEARDENKNLKFDCEQPPAKWIGGVTLDQMFQYFFNHHPLSNSTTYDELVDWFKTKHWYIRPKTW